MWLDDSRRDITRLVQESTRRQTDRGRRAHLHTMARREDRFQRKGPHHLDTGLKRRTPPVDLGWAVGADGPTRDLQEVHAAHADTMYQ